MVRQSNSVRPFNQEPSLPTTTDDAVKLFLPGQKILFRPDNDCPEVSLTICKLSKPVTKSVVVLAKPDSDVVIGAEHVVIKIYDPRYLDERISTREFPPSCPWDLVIEQEAVTNRPEVSKMSMDELACAISGYLEDSEDSSRENESEESETDDPKDLGGEDGPEDSSGEDEDEDEEDKELRILMEERYYRLMMGSYESELRAYKRLKDLQGSGIPRLILAGQFLPLDERAILPPALLFEYIPSISLFDITSEAITPVIREQFLSIIESLPSYGVIQNDMSVTNIHFTPPERPVRAFILDFGRCLLREEEDSEEDWLWLGEEGLRCAKLMLDDERFRQFTDIPRSRFQ